LLQVVVLFTVHCFPFQRWFTLETLNPGLFTSFLYSNTMQGNWCYHVHHLYNIPWAPSSFVQKVSTIMCKLQFSSSILLWKNEQKPQLIWSKYKDPYPCLIVFKNKWKVENAFNCLVRKSFAIDNEQNCWRFAWIDDNSDNAYWNMNPNHNRPVI
jgi:hypothetical protein